VNDILPRFLEYPFELCYQNAMRMIHQHQLKANNALKRNMGQIYNLSHAKPMEFKKSVRFFGQYNFVGNGMQFPLTQSVTEKKHKHCSCE
jgi:hypothetical protein